MYDDTLSLIKQTTELAKEVYNEHDGRPRELRPHEEQFLEAIRDVIDNHRGYIQSARARYGDGSPEYEAIVEISLRQKAKELKRAHDAFLEARSEIFLR